LKLITKLLLYATLFAVANVGVCFAGTVTIKPGANIPSEVASNPAGTTFLIYPGTYRLTTPINAKTGDSFVGQTTCAPPKTSCPAILSGSRVLSSFQRSGNYYYVTGQTQQGDVNTARCDTDYPGCSYPEDLFFDGKPLTHVTSLSDVVSGSWYFDYGANTIYFIDNPSGHTVETSFVPAAFEFSSANNVTIKYLTVKEFATPILTGAIEGGSTGVGTTNQGANWVVEYNEVLLNHSEGIHPNFGWQIINNYVHNNGELGISAGLGGGNSDGSGSTNSNVLIQGNEISFNDYAHVAPHYGAGGAKFGKTIGLVFRNNNVHDNEGSGIHLDTYNKNFLIDGNTFSNNTENGIFDEVSYASTARNNTFSGNGYDHPNSNEWMYATGILSATSQGLVAYCNTVNVSSEGGNGIGMLYQTRANEVVSINNNYHHNAVVFEGSTGWVGAMTDSPTDPTQQNFYKSNTFDNNWYHMPGTSRQAFAWNTKKMDTFATFQAAGQEKHGTVDTYYTISVPTVKITSPADQSTVSGTVAVNATAADTGMAVSKVEFYVDWALKSTDTSSSYSYNLNTAGLASGQHTLTALAYNADGVRACYAVTVNIK